MKNLIGLYFLFYFSSAIFAQQLVPYSSFEFINPAEEYESLPADINSYDAQFRNFHLLDDSVFVLSGTIKYWENDYYTYKGFHLSYDKNFQLKNNIYSGKAVITNRNNERFAVSATNNYLVDFNSYCANLQDLCLEDSSRLINTVYNSTLDVIVSDTIAINDHVDLRRPIFFDSLISTSSYGNLSNAIVPKVIWFDEESQDLGYNDFSEFNFDFPYPNFLGIKDSLFYFLRKEPNGTQDEYFFEVYNNEQIINSCSIDTISNDSLLNIYSFTVDADGNFYFIVFRSGIDMVVKVNSNFELIWKTLVNVRGSLDRNEFLKVDGYLNHIYLYAPSNIDFTVKVFNKQTGEILNDITLLTFSPLEITPSLFPLNINGELWYYNSISSWLDTFPVWDLYRFDQTGQAIMHFQLKLPQSEDNSGWNFIKPIFNSDTIYIYGFFDKTENGIEVYPDKYCFAKYPVESLTLSTDEISNQFDFILSPNPAHNYIMISNLPAEKTQIQIIDLQGRVLFSQINQQQIKAQLPIDYLSSGVYFVTVKCEECVQTKKMIKN